MDQHTATPETEERSSVGRRTVLKGAAGVAWTVPVVVALGTTVAAAGSFGKLQITAKPDFIFAGTFVDGTHTADTGNDTSVPFTVKSAALPVAQTITVTITSGSLTATGTATFAIGQTTGTVTVNASTLADGTGPDGNGLTIIATSSSDYVVASDPVYVIKDTAQPIVGLPTGTYNGSGSPQTLTLNGTVGALTSPTSDQPATLTNTSITKRSNSTLLTPLLETRTVGTGTWNTQFTSAQNTNVEGGNDYAFTLTQTDGAGNSTTRTFTIST